MTRFWCLLLVLCAASTATASPPLYVFTIVNDNAAVYYLLGETGSSIPNYGTAGAALDATFNGTPIKGVATTGNDKGVTFDSSDDFIESNGTAPAAFTGNPTMSIEAIVRIPANAVSKQWAPFLHWGSASSGSAVSFGFHDDSNDRLFTGFYNSGLRSVTTFPQGAVWHHLVWVRNGGANDSQTGSILYVDGAAVPLTADTDLLGIRSRNAAARALTVNPESHGMWRNVNIAIALLGLVAVVGFAWLRRRAVQPIISKEA